MMVFIGRPRICDKLVRIHTRHAWMTTTAFGFGPFSL